MPGPASAPACRSTTPRSRGHGIPEDEPPCRLDRAVRSNGRHRRPAHGDAADPALSHGGSDVVLLDRARRHLQQHRAHTIPPPADRVARRRPRGLVVRAVLHRCLGRAAELEHQGRARAGLRVLREGEAIMLYDLRRADVRVKWLVTGLLATLGLSYVFGAAMVALYAGFTPQSVAATYAGAEMSMPMPPETTMVVQRPISMADFAGPEVHTVDTKLLIQDTHVHVPMYGLIGTCT